MWLFTRDGFYSLVEHRDDPSVIMVRARMREDLVDMAAKIDPTLAKGIVEMPAADYRWRMNVPRSVMATYSANAVKGIAYKTSVKTEIGKGDTRRKSALMRVWSAMMSLQRPEAILPSGAPQKGSIIERHWSDIPPVEHDALTLSYYDDTFLDENVAGVTEVVTTNGPRWVVQISDPHGNVVDVSTLDDQSDAEDLADQINAHVDAWF